MEVHGHIYPIIILWNLQKNLNSNMSWKYNQIIYERGNFDFYVTIQI